MLEDNHPGCIHAMLPEIGSTTAGEAEEEELASELERQLSRKAGQLPGTLFGDTLLIMQKRKGEGWILNRQGQGTRIGASGLSISNPRTRLMLLAVWQAKLMHKRLLEHAAAEEKRLCRSLQKISFDSRTTESTLNRI